MLEEKFEIVYTKFKLHFYQEIFERFQNREASLTTVETFAMETIQALGSPTINEFASFMRISPPNAAYKINSLIRKGYIQKIQSEHDKREYHLQVTQKYKEYYNISNDYVHVVTERMRERFTPDECAKLEELTTTIRKDLLPQDGPGSAEPGHRKRGRAACQRVLFFIRYPIPEARQSHRTHTSRSFSAAGRTQ